MPASKIPPTTKGIAKTFIAMRVRVEEGDIGGQTRTALNTVFQDGSFRESPEIMVFLHITNRRIGFFSRRTSTICRGHQRCFCIGRGVRRVVGLENLWSTGRVRGQTPEQ